MSTKELTFTEEMEQDIAERLGFEKSEWLGDWWLPGGNPQLRWAELIEWAIRILSAEATRVHFPDAYLAAEPVYAVNAGAELPVSNVSGAKRVNAARGEWHDFSEVMGINALFLPNIEARMREIMQRPANDTGNRFRLHGKDEGCEVEGTWHD